MSAFEAFREQITVAIATAQRERDHWARQAEKLSELLEGGEPSPPEPEPAAKAPPAGKSKPTPKAVDGPKPKPTRRPQASSVAARVEAALHGERTPPAAQSFGPGEPEVGGEVVHRIEAALSESDVALTIHSLARAASCTNGAVVAALRRLRSDGRATELEPGKWRWAAEPVADLVR